MDGPSMGDLLVKGVAMSAIVDALRAAREQTAPHVPEHLRGYLDDPPYAGDWYPVQELVDLCAAARKGLLAEMDEREAYELMGRLVMQRDIKGDRSLLPPKARGGAFQGALASRLDYETYTRRAIALWQLYLDQGEQIGERAGERMLRVRLVGTTSPAKELCWITTGYYAATCDMLGPGHVAVHEACSARGDAQCAWVVTYADAFDPAQLDAFGPWPKA